MTKTEKRPVRVVADVRTFKSLPDSGIRFAVAVDIWPEDADSTKTGTGERFRNAVADAVSAAIGEAWLKACTVLAHERELLTGGPGKTWPNRSDGG